MSHSRAMASPHIALPSWTVCAGLARSFWICSGQGSALLLARARPLETSNSGVQHGFLVFSRWNRATPSMLSPSTSFRQSSRKGS